jgi:hypothetical protein
MSKRDRERIQSAASNPNAPPSALPSLAPEETSLGVPALEPHMPSAAFSPSRLAASSIPNTPPISNLDLFLRHTARRFLLLVKEWTNPKKNPKMLMSFKIEEDVNVREG